MTSALSIMWVVVLLLAILGAPTVRGQDTFSPGCVQLNNCNGNGQCVTQQGRGVCVCFLGWGAPGEPTNYVAPDCTARTCPAWASWADVSTSATNGHAPAECADRGTCNRVTGKCQCFTGFSGDACQRKDCINSCSGHGKCVSIGDAAVEPNAEPAAPSLANSYTGIVAESAWDKERLMGCVCDSTWPVGFGAGQTQVASFWGPDCSLKRCPSGDNPQTVAVETDCHGKANNGATAGAGAVGNLCYVPCSNKGLCDDSTGLCKCFTGWTGSNCGIQDALAK